MRDEVNLVEAKVNFDAAMARTFAVNNVDVISAKNITNGSDTKIPGTTASGELYGLPRPNQIPPAKPTSSVPGGVNASATPVSRTTTRITSQIECFAARWRLPRAGLFLALVSNRLLAALFCLP